MQLCANKLDKKDFFGKSDPFLVFYRSNEDGTWVNVFSRGTHPCPAVTMVPLGLSGWMWGILDSTRTWAQNSLKAAHNMCLTSGEIPGISKSMRPYLWAQSCPQGRFQASCSSPGSPSATRRRLWKTRWILFGNPSASLCGHCAMETMTGLLQCKLGSKGTRAWEWDSWAPECWQKCHNSFGGSFLVRQSFGHGDK